MKRYINSKTGATLEVPDTVEISGEHWGLDAPSGVENSTDTDDTEEDDGEDMAPLQKAKGKKKA